jgi:hypothetical protein
MKTALGDDKPAFISWESNKSDSLQERCRFVRHFAICLVQLDIWNDPMKPLFKGSKTGLTGSSLGPDLIPLESSGVSWKEDGIQNIDGVLELGLTTYDDEAISQQCNTSRERSAASSCMADIRHYLVELL